MGLSDSRVLDSLRVLFEIATDNDAKLTHPASGATIELSSPEDRLSFIAGGLDALINRLEATPNA